VNRVNVGRRRDAVEGGPHEAPRSFIGGQNGRPAIIASRGVKTSFHNWLLFLGVRFCLNIFLVLETKYTNIVSRVEQQRILSPKIMKPPEQLHQELRQRILGLSGVTERPNAGIHEDAFFVGGKMFMHIHSHGHCDIRLAKPDQERVLAEGKARPHRWAPEQGYATFMARDEKDLAPAMELIQLSHDHFAGDRRS